MELAVVSKKEKQAPLPDVLAAHVDEHNAHTQVGGYKDLSRYSAVGDVDGITLGFEIECEYRHRRYLYGNDWDDAKDMEREDIEKSEEDALKAISNSMNLGYVLAERDGSLHDTGIEFVTGYCTWKSHKPRLERFFTEYKKDFEEDEGAGIHIHIGRNEHTQDLSFRHLYWFIMCDENEHLIGHVARRYDTEYCHADRSYDWSMDIDDPDRYDAVNARRYTYEVRLFDSTTNFLQLQQYAEFTIACVEFLIKNKTATNTFVADEGRDFSKSPIYYKRFIEFVSNKAARFPNLHGHLENLK